MITRWRYPIHRDVGLRRESAYMIYIYLGVVGLEVVVGMVRVDV